MWVSAWVSTPPTTIIDDGLDSVLAFGIVSLAILSGNRKRVRDDTHRRPVGQDSDEAFDKLLLGHPTAGACTAEARQIQWKTPRSGRKRVMTTADYTQAHPNTTTNTILTVGNLGDGCV